ncbi:arsenate reductase ArsC [Parvularcula marina]|uniref:Arsenate reductase ArsC n=1 Tax=Parvularcula marina TaxID=2292771 RepID=A0A371RJ88_9PROT|nr:arsenate reductase ArsC [Parvularcula marina]RFB05499.1 arsenate reductase ArsC [Parvularcula marina]
MTNVLFLCTGNSARSILSESYLNSIDGYRAFSAGSKPVGGPNPFALSTLKKHDIPVVTGDGGAPRSKSWDEFAAPDAPLMDIVITVCDNAAGETCPVWPVRPGGQMPEKLHWSFPDPAAATGSDEDKKAEFDKVFADIRARIDDFVRARQAA